MRRPRVSVIMPVYNGARFLAEAIESILSQSLSDLELLVVDNASTDRTGEIICSFEDARIRYWKMEQNFGAAKARNFALAEARAPYVACMDADDVSLPDRLHRQVTFLDDRPSVGLVGCGYEITDGRGNPLFSISWCKDSAPCNEIVAQKPYFIGSSICFRRECVEEVGPYRPGLVMHEDWDFCLRVGERYGIGMLGGVSYKYRMHDVSTCARNAGKNIRSMILVRKLAQGRRLEGRDRLAHLSETKARRFLRLYFHPYDRYEAGSLPLHYFMLAQRCLKEGAWSAAGRYFKQAMWANPFRTDTMRLGTRVLRDKREFDHLGSSDMTAKRMAAQAAAAGW